ncbi:MAG: hypothetical protein DSO09_03050 [Candidatus Methanomethylicota archaeon]|uniref:Uncharacterized protein n=1 Tax=Thermoproteota archaeon TaxID=2056631 RepID=A0A520KDZ9_9CREN|nr:MAG: hypothetical protein EF809_05670 [Candidatus Verstraetearchaeota archaeon]TDA38838.1 MAG: hypothetical protein DSO09_03050 [Candidatus Verstraetearchaeota archaeon]
MLLNKIKIKIINKMRYIWAFILAASVAPITYLFSIPCGFSCAQCPLGGICILAYPLIFLGVIIIKFIRKIKSLISKIA